MHRIQYIQWICVRVKYSKLHSLLLFCYGGVGSHGNDDIVLLSEVVVVLCLEVKF